MALGVLLSLTGAAKPAPARPDAGSALDAGAAPDAGPVGPQSFTAEAPPRVTFGEPFPYTIRVTHPPGEAYALPRLVDLGDFDLVDAKKDDARSGANVVTTFHLQLRGWGVGSKAIPEIKLEAIRPEGTSQLAIPGPSVELVGTIAPDAGEVPLRDIAGPVDVPVRTYRVLYALAGLLALALLGLAISHYLRRERPAFVAPPPPPLPPEVRARQALQELLAEDLASKGRQRELYFRLSEIVRRYLGERFGFAAIDLTTAELLAALRVRPTPGLDLTHFARECEAHDLAKFARFQPDANTCKASIDAALAMIDSTTAAARAAAGNAEVRPV